MAYPEYMNENEADIIDIILFRAFELHHTVTVYDGEEYTLKKSRDYASITAEVAATDMTYLEFHAEHGIYLGVVVLVHGNGCDVICDMSDNIDMEDILKPAEEYAQWVSDAEFHNGSV